MKNAFASVHVNDPVAAHQYYTKTLGFVSRRHMAEAQLAIMVSPEEKEGTALLLKPNNNAIAKTYQESLYKKSIPAITPGSTEIHADHKKRKAKGVVLRKEPKQTDFGTGAVFKDTFNNHIQLYQV